jgi:hypothetical protein
MSNLTTEDLVLGNTQEAPKKEALELVFSKDTKYKVKTKGKDNESIVNGVLVNNILSFEDKNKLARGASEIEANGLIITRIIEESDVRKNRTTEETETVAPKPKKKKRVADD